MLGQFPGILTEQPSTAFTEDAVRVRVYFIDADLNFNKHSSYVFFNHNISNKNNTLIIA